MAYREGRSALDVARELYEDAQARRVQAEIGYQDAAVQAHVVKLEIERTRHLLGQLVEVERRRLAILRSMGENPPDEDTEDVTRARAEVTEFEAKLEGAEEAVRRALDARNEASQELLRAQRELESLL